MEQKDKKRVVIPFRPVFRWLVRLRRSPKAIAGGFALGTFIAFTPTVGVQMVIVIFLATMLNCNRPAAILAIWISNPATMAPLYTFNYMVGTFFWSGPPVGEVYRSFTRIAGQLINIGSLDIMEQWRLVRQLSGEIVVPLLIGSVIVGMIAAIIVYALSLALFRWLMIKKANRMVLRNK